jgi:hypothetical protein
MPAVIKHLQNHPWSQVDPTFFKEHLLFGQLNPRGNDQENYLVQRSRNMKLYSIADSPDLIGESKTCRYSPLKSFLFATLFLSISFVCLILAYQGGSMGYGEKTPPELLYILGFIFGVMALMTLSRFFKAIKPVNWVVKFGADRILVKYRSYLNAHLPEEDLIIVEIPFSEIEWVRKTKETLYTEDSESTLTRFFTFLDMKLKSSNVEELKNALKFERNRRPPIESLNHDLFNARKYKKPEQEIAELKEKIRIEIAKHPKGGKRVTTVNGHHPVKMTEPNILRVEWNGLWPRINQMLNSLQQKITVEPELKLKSDYTSSRSSKNLDDQILDLAERGRKIEAVKLVRIKYGYSLTEAREFVEKLIKK